MKLMIRRDSNQSQPISQLQESSDATDINNNDVSSTGNTMTIPPFYNFGEQTRALTSLHNTIREKGWDTINDDITQFR